MVRKTCNHPSLAKIGEEEGETDGEKDDKNKAGLAARRLTLNMHNMISRNENLHSCKLLFVTLLVRNLRKEDHKIIIFAETLGLLKLIRTSLERDNKW
uniref:Uncharacterized protein n=1 Tax=Tanacetum cinerariifolium TaxID=118510 RepID=A0A699HW87_TANCI|nr:hypothetical protein [Tanacetum cinerariifolium]